MHPRYLNQRDEAAQKAIEASAATLAERLGLLPETLASLTATDRDPAVQTMLRREGVASLLGVVVAGLEESADAGSAPSETSQSPALPKNALELIQNAGGLSKPKAEAVLAALFPEPTPTE